jgi:hypothetical protein
MRFRGRVEHTRRDSHGIVSGGVAWLGAGLSVEGHEGAIGFMLDTGAALTVLRSRDASRILGPTYQHLMDADHISRLTVESLSGQTTLLLRPATIALTAIDGETLRLNLLLAIEEPDSVSADDALRPSLLGRDVLRHFRLELTYGENPSLVLETL